ncbi:uncharacterized protein LOC117604550 [Osmia lignaria lignaria]|uniref:uncharacterized protein LOC117604550 n=1 Tax=Osmia lignaria lignaria TaxID=1437193 RepID=UPI00402B6AD7
MSIHNTGKCSLTFQLRVIDVLEGTIPQDQENKVQRRKKVDGDSDKKSSKKAEFREHIQPQEEFAIFGRNLKPSTNDYFSFDKFDEKMQIVVGENNKMEFIVRFQRQDEEKNSQNKETTSKKEKKKKKSGKSEENEKLNYCYVAVLKLMLGTSTRAHDFVIICSTK